jgi:hypothetical protein
LLKKILHKPPLFSKILPTFAPLKMLFPYPIMLATLTYTLVLAAIYFGIKAMELNDER